MPTSMVPRECLQGHLRAAVERLHRSLKEKPRRVDGALGGGAWTNLKNSRLHRRMPLAADLNADARNL